MEVWVIKINQFEQGDSHLKIRETRPIKTKMLLTPGTRPTLGIQLLNAKNYWQGQGSGPTEGGIFVR